MLKASKAHLNAVNETYFEHQGIALRYAAKCLQASLMAFMHALVPGWFQTSASDLVKALAHSRKPPRHREQ